MLRVTAALAASVAFVFSAAALPKPEIDHAAVARIAATCTADGAFGHKFGEKAPPEATKSPTFLTVSTLTRLGPEWAPLNELDASYTSETRVLSSLTARVVFNETDAASSDRKTIQFKNLFDTLTVEIASTRTFAEQDTKIEFGQYYTASYSSSTERWKGFTLEIQWSGPTFNISCRDGKLMKLRMHELLGPDSVVPD